MTRLTTLLDPASDAFKANAAHNLVLIETLRGKIAQASLGGSTLARPSWRSARWRRTTCTAAKRRALG